MERMRPLAEIMPQLLEHLPLEPVAVLRSLWKTLVGATLAERTEPLTLHDGVLRVAVSDRAWKTEVRALEAELIHKINEASGRTLVRELRLVLREESPEGEAKGEG